jgi:exodeoxyribonuclease X
METFIAIVDLETTGFERDDGHMPVEIGQCKLLTGFDLFGEPDWSWLPTITQPISTLINPGISIPPEASAIHHLIDADVVDAPLWESALDNYMRELQDSPRKLTALAAHSAHMEQQWLTPETTGNMPWIDTWKCSLRAWPEAPRHSNQCLRYWLNPIGLDRDVASPAHRAGPDAYVTAHLLRELLRLHPLQTLIQWSTEPALLIRVPFGKPQAQGGPRGMKWTEVDTSLLLWVLDRDFSEDILHTCRIELERRQAEENEPDTEIESMEE